MLKEDHKDLLWCLLNSGEMPVNYKAGLEDVVPTFRGKQEEFVNLFEDEEWEELWSLSQDARFEVASKLNQKDWSGILPVTDDFVVIRIGRKLM